MSLHTYIYVCICSNQRPLRREQQTITGKERAEKMKLLMALLTFQLCFGGFHIVSRVALNIGVSKVVYPVYRYINALLLLSPLAYFLEWKSESFYAPNSYMENVILKLCFNQ